MRLAYWKLENKGGNLDKVECQTYTIGQKTVVYMIKYLGKKFLNIKENCIGMYLFQVKKKKEVRKQL